MAKHRDNVAGSNSAGTTWGKHRKFDADEEGWEDRRDPNRHRYSGNLCGGFGGKTICHLCNRDMYDHASEMIGWPWNYKPKHLRTEDGNQD